MYFIFHSVMHFQTSIYLVLSYLMKPFKLILLYSKIYKLIFLFAFKGLIVPLSSNSLKYKESGSLSGVIGSLLLPSSMF
jgi:hypothetical protein